MKVFNVFRIIGNFLFNKINRELLIFLFFVLLSGIFWLMTTLNETFEQEILVPIRYKNIPKNAILTSGDTDTLRVHVSDRGISLLTYLYDKSPAPLEIDFMKYAGENGVGTINATDLQKLVSSHLAASATVVSVKPETFTFYYNYGETKKVPVRFRGEVTPDNMHFISSTHASADSVIIYASPRMLDSIKEVFTEPVYQRNLADSFSVNARLQRIQGVKMVPDRVTFSFTTDILAQLSYNEVPIVPINVPEGEHIVTFPAKVKINFVAGLKVFENITPADFAVVLDYNDIVGDSTLLECGIWIQKMPEGVKNATLSTNKVELIVNKNSQ